MDIPSILISQYLASLEMLKQVILQCPESVWNAPQDTNKFWHTAYHALYFVDEYLQYPPQGITPWRKHRPGWEDFPAPPGGEYHDKDTLLEYLAYCQQQVREILPGMDLAAGEAHGPLSMLELQIYSIRHTMQHVGELLERLGSRTGAQIAWVDKVWD